MCGGINNDERRSEESVDVAKVEAAVRGDGGFFWAYMLMVDIIATMFLALSSWCDSCSCHQEVPGHGGFSGRERRSYWRRWLKGRYALIRCPYNHLV